MVQAPTVELPEPTRHIYNGSFRAEKVLCCFFPYRNDVAELCSASASAHTQIHCA